MQFEIIFIHNDILVVMNYVYCHLFIELHINIMLNPIGLDKVIYACSSRQPNLFLSLNLFGRVDL